MSDFILTDKTYTTTVPGKKLKCLPGNELNFSDTKEQSRKGSFYTNTYKKIPVKELPKTEEKPSALSTFVVPDFIKKANDEVKAHSETYWHYKKNVLRKEDLKKPAVALKNKNRQGLSRYVFFQDVRACRNGFLYYILPLLISLLVLFSKISAYNFLANFALSATVLTDFLLFRKVFKSDKSGFAKGFWTILIVGVNILLIYVLKNTTDFFEKIYLSFALKIFLIVFSIYYFGKFFVVFGAMYKMDCSMDFGNTCIINAGKPRCGKSTISVNEGKILATLKWQQLQYDYYIWLSKAQTKRFKERASNEELLEWNEIKISYQFYIIRRCIPCLWSNIGIEDYQGRTCHTITLEHLKGLERLPIYSVVVLDEIGAMLKADDGLNKKGHEKPLDVSDMFRLGGHFLKWTVIGTEQDFNHIFIDCRRVVGFNRVIEGQEWICKPTVLYSILRFIKWLKIDGLDKTITARPIMASLLDKFEKFVRSIGFRAVKFKFAENTQTKAGISGNDSDSKMTVLGGTKVRYLPSNLVAKYDNRAYRAKYASYFDKEIHGELFKSLLIDPKDESSRKYVNSTKSLEEKYDAIYSDIKEVS